MAYEGLVALRRVIYDPEQQHKLVSSTIARTCEALERFAQGKSIAQLSEDHTLPSFAMLLASYLRE